MRELRVVSGRVAVLDRADVDTDQIIPKQFLKRIERTGYGEFLFFDWAKDPAFELNRPEAAGAPILFTGRNFGCGSSREHAAWAIEDAGYRVVIAPSFGDIFRTNAVKTGLAPVVLEPEAYAEVRAALEADATLTVDLERLVVEHPSGLSVELRVRRARSRDAPARPRRHRAHARAGRRDRRVRSAHDGRASTRSRSRSDLARDLWHLLVTRSEVRAAPRACPRRPGGHGSPDSGTWF